MGRRSATDAEVDALFVENGLKGVRFGSVYMPEGKKNSTVPVLWDGCPHGVTDVRVGDLKSGHTAGCRPCGQEAAVAATFEREFSIAFADGYELWRVPSKQYRDSREASGFQTVSMVGWSCPKGHSGEMQLVHWSSGARCSSCAQSGFNNSKEAWVYLLQRIVDGEVQCQYGKTNRIDQRLRKHSKHGWIEVDRMYFSDGSGATRVEDEIKAAMKALGIYRTVYDGSDGTTEAWGESMLTPFSTVAGLWNWAIRALRSESHG
jgi:hypothetical protein